MTCIHVVMLVFIILGLEKCIQVNQETDLHLQINQCQGKG